MNISRKNFRVELRRERSRKAGPEEIQNNPDVIKAYLGNKQRG